MNRSFAPACLLLMLAGCSYIDAEQRLVQQARKGVTLCLADAQRQQQRADQFHILQRQRLDEAFDADALAQPALTAGWVIEARKAYAVGLDALNAQRAAALAADQANQSNLKSIDAVLSRLELLQSLPQQLFEEVGK